MEEEKGWWHCICAARVQASALRISLASPKDQVRRVNIYKQHLVGASVDCFVQSLIAIGIPENKQTNVIGCVTIILGYPRYLSSIKLLVTIEPTSLTRGWALPRA